jgi:hypothetical protein
MGGGGGKNNSCKEENKEIRKKKPFFQKKIQKSSSPSPNGPPLSKANDCPDEPFEIISEIHTFVNYVL